MNFPTRASLLIAFGRKLKRLVLEALLSIIFDIAAQYLFRISKSSDL